MVSKNDKTKGDSQMSAILESAISLEETLHKAAFPLTLGAHVTKDIEQLVLYNSTIATSKATELDQVGTRLWNLGSRLRQNENADAQLLCAVRVFACLLIDCAGRCCQGSVSNEIRIFKTALRTTKQCLDERQLHLAEKIVERAAFYDERLQRAPHDQGDTFSPLWIEYMTIRIALAWRLDRLDIAKLMLTKLTSAQKTVDSVLAEELSDLLFELGKDLSRKSRWTDASFWLDAAHDMLTSQVSDGLTSDAAELRVSIMHAMVKSLIHQEGELNRGKAWSLISALSIEYGDKLVVLLLKLELLGIEPTPSAEDYRSLLMRIAAIVHLTDSNVNTILHHVYKLKNLSPDMAHTVLFEFLSSRLFGGDYTQWSEKILITIIWNLASSMNIQHAQDTLAQVFDHVEAHSGAPVSSPATHAAQILLWKRIEAAYGQESFEIAEKWCHLSLHKIFGSSGSMNLGKLQRKLILCALGMHDASKAWSVSTNMSEMNQSEVSTQYLLYKCAIRTHDAEMASQCFNNICSRLSKDANKDASLIYACVLEAQREGDHDQIVIALQRVVEQYNYTAPSGVHLPALLRCTARLLMRSSETIQIEGIDSLCQIFEGAAVQAKRSDKQVDENAFGIKELDWFSRNCYNLALKICSIWPPQQTLRLMQAALKFIDLYPIDLEPAVLADLSLRRLFCNFVLCSLHISLARHEDTIELQLQHYLSLRQRVAHWRLYYVDQISRLDGGARSDLITKHTALISYDFEAAARLKSWEDLDSIVTECRGCEDAQVYAVLADILLTCGAPTEVFITSLQHIVSASWQTDTKDIEKLSRWIRCILSQAISSDHKSIEILLDEVITIVKTTNEAQGPNKPYPAEELEWLATTTFNRAIDFYCSSQDARCRSWAEKALTLGAQCKDGGALHRLLQSKFQDLVWHEE